MPGMSPVLWVSTSIASQVDGLVYLSPREGLELVSFKRSRAQQTFSSRLSKFSIAEMNRRSESQI
jgi:hypothetical protein